MGKILAFVIGTIGISLLLLAPVIWVFDSITTVIKKANLFLDSLSMICEGLAIIAFVVIVSVATLVALLLWGGKKDVL